jgi:hypothetical protein
MAHDDWDRRASAVVAGHVIECGTQCAGRNYAFPSLRALKFAVRGLLGDGVAASLRADPQTKSLGEYLSTRRLPVPAALLED